MFSARPERARTVFCIRRVVFPSIRKKSSETKQAAEERVCRGKRRFLLGRKGGVALAEQKHVGVVQERSSRELTAKDRVQNGIFR